MTDLQQAILSLQNRPNKSPTEIPFLFQQYGALANSTTAEFNMALGKKSFLIRDILENAGQIEPIGFDCKNSQDILNWIIYNRGRLLSPPTPPTPSANSLFDYGRFDNYIESANSGLLNCADNNGNTSNSNTAINTMKIANQNEAATLLSSIDSSSTSLLAGVTNRRLNLNSNLSHITPLIHNWLDKNAAAAISSKQPTLPQVESAFETVSNRSASASHHFKQNHRQFNLIDERKQSDSNLMVSNGKYPMQVVPPTFNHHQEEHQSAFSQSHFYQNLYYYAAFQQQIANVICNSKDSNNSSALYRNVTEQQFNADLDILHNADHKTTRSSQLPSIITQQLSSGRLANNNNRKSAITKMQTTRSKSKSLKQRLNTKLQPRKTNKQTTFSKLQQTKLIKCKNENNINVPIKENKINVNETSEASSSSSSSSSNGLHLSNSINQLLQQTTTVVDKENNGQINADKLLTQFNKDKYTTFLKSNSSGENSNEIGISEQDVLLNLANQSSKCKLLAEGSVIESEENAWFSFGNNEDQENNNSVEKCNCSDDDNIDDDNDDNDNEFGDNGQQPPHICAAKSRCKKLRRNRTVFTELQLMGLERRFDSQKYLSTPDRADLARALGLTQLQVKTWYQNRRMKWKKQVMQNGCPYPPTKPKGRPKKDSIPTYGIEFTNSLLSPLFVSAHSSETVHNNNSKPSNNNISVEITSQLSSSVCNTPSTLN